MGNRHQAREAAIQYLYQHELEVETLTDRPENFTQHFKVAEPFRGFFFQLTKGVLEHRKELDTEIEEAAENWKLYRIAKLDLQILRVAVWELIHCPETDYQVIIDEAVELAKAYGAQD